MEAIAENCCTTLRNGQCIRCLGLTYRLSGTFMDMNSPNRAARYYTAGAFVLIGPLDVTEAIRSWAYLPGPRGYISTFAERSGSEAVF